MRAKTALFAAAIAAGGLSFSSEVTPERAVDATSAWVSQWQTPERLPTGEVRSFSAGGTNVFYLVALKGGGWAAMPADDSASPLLAWTTEPDAALPQEDDGAPGWDILGIRSGFGSMFGDEDDDLVYDEASRPRFTVEAVTVSPEVKKSKSAGASAVAAVPASSAEGLTWQSLESDRDGAAAWRKAAVSMAKGAPTISTSSAPADLRVPTLMASRWSQSGGIYNYYTPPYKLGGGAVCGCVATAMAQIMYYFKYPNGDFTMPTSGFSAKYAGSGFTAYMWLGDRFANDAFNTAKNPGYTPYSDFGGKFSWSDMADRPGSGSTDRTKAAIGMLTYNCGCASHMGWKYGGSGATTRNQSDGYKNAFGYGQADYIAGGSGQNLSIIKGSLLPSLDAKIPCSVEVPKHEIVADGYGFIDGCLFVHMNMGWGGSSDAYYREPVSGGGTSAGAIKCYVANIFTNGTGRIVSGRVTDSAGKPVAGATVTAALSISDENAPELQTVTTDSRGIYAVRTPLGDCTTTVSVAKSGMAATLASRTATTSSSVPLGDSWGNDFTMYDSTSAFVWTGGANDGKMGSTNNWSTTKVPTNGATVVFGPEATGQTINNNISSFAPGSVLFTSDCDGATIIGNMMTNVNAFSSESAATQTVNAAVYFKDTINVYGTEGGIDFAGGATGKYPSGNGTCRGQYRLTTTDLWYPPAQCRVPSGSKLTVGRLSGISHDGLVIDEGGEVEVTGNCYTQGNDGYLLTCNKGVFRCRGYFSAEAGGTSRIVSNNTDGENYEQASDGWFIVNGLRTWPEANNLTRYLAPSLKYVIGSYGITGKTWNGWNNWNTTMFASADFTVTGTLANYSTAPGNLNKLYLHTEYEGAAHTVTVSGTGTFSGSRLEVWAMDGGVLSFQNDLSTFGAGLFVTNGCTLRLGADCRPGRGDVTLSKGTALELPATYSSPVRIAGSLRVSADGESEKVTVRFGDGSGTVPEGYYIIATAGGSIDPGIVEALEFANPTAGGAPAAFEFLGSGAIALSVGSNASPADQGMYIWDGEAGDGKFSTARNWVGDVVPVEGSTVMLHSAADCTVTNDLSFGFGSVQFIRDDGTMTVCGNTVRAPSIQNLSSKHHVFLAPVEFPAEAEADLSLGSGTYMEFPGGLVAHLLANTGSDAYVSGDFTLTSASNDWSTASRDYIVVKSGSTLRLRQVLMNGWSDESACPNFNIESGATLVVDDWMILDSAEDDGIHTRYIADKIDGTLVVAGWINAYSWANVLSARQASSGRIVAGHLRNRNFYATFGLDAGTAQAPAFYVGGPGMESDAVYVSSSVGNSEVALTNNAGFASFQTAEGASGGKIWPASTDIEIVAHVNAFGPLELGTTDTNGVARTVNVTGGIGGGGTVSAVGTGTVKLDFDVASIPGYFDHEDGTSYSVGGGATLWVADGASPAIGNLTIGGNGTLRIPSGGTLSITGAVGVASLSYGSPRIQVGDGSPLSAGTYTLVNAEGGVAAGAPSALWLANPVPAGMEPTFSADGNSLVLTVAAFPADGYYWTGLGGDGNFATPSNWANNLSPTNGCSLYVRVTSAATLHYDLDVAPASLTFLKGTEPVTIDGAMAISLALAIANEELSVMHTIEAAVEYKTGEDWAPIDVTGPVDFQGGVKGTLPANHTKLYGNYTLTATAWSLPSTITLAAGATVTASGMKLSTNGHQINAGAGSMLRVSHLESNGSAPFGAFAGTLVANQIYPPTGDTTFNRGFTGVLRIGRMYFYSNNLRRTLTFSPHQSADVVITGPDGVYAYGSNIQIGGNVFHSAGNWKFQTQHHNISTSADRTGHILINAGIVVDTSDYDDPTAPGHTVTVMRNDTSENLLAGSGGVLATGNGALSFQCSAKFTGGLTASNGVTVVVDNGVNPGNGNVTVKDAATFVLKGTTTVGGCLVLDAGSTLVVSNLSAAARVTAGSLSLPASGRVNLVVGGAALADGVYALVRSAAATEQGDLTSKFDIDVSAVTSDPSVGIVARGGGLFLVVGETHNVWVGGTSLDFDERENWLDMNLPTAAWPLDMRAAEPGATLNANLSPNPTFPTVLVGEGRLKFSGSLNVDELTEGSEFLVVASGGAFTARTVRVSNRISYMNSGEYVVTDELAVTLGGADLHVAYDYSSAPFKFEKVTLGDSGTSKWFYFALSPSTATYPKNVFIGAGGLNFAEGSLATIAYCMDYNRSLDNTTVRPWHSDYTIGTKPGATLDVRINKGAHFGTTDETGVARTVTADGIFAGPGALYVEGSGRFVVNAVNTLSGAVEVLDTATLQVNPGKKTGAGALTVFGGATLMLPGAGAGTATVGGTLTLDAGSTLVVSNLVAGTPALSAASLAVAGEGTPTLVVGGPAPLGIGRYTIVSCTGAIDENILNASLDVRCGVAAGAGVWYRLDIVGGALVLEVSAGNRWNPAHCAGSGCVLNFNIAANWLSGRVPAAGEPVTIGVDAASTLVCDIPGFSPSSITFPVGSAEVTVTGAEAIAGVVAITNLSTTASHTIDVPVYFAGDIKVKQAAMAEESDIAKAHVTFAGGAHAAEGHAIESGNCSAVYSRCMFGDYYLYPASGSPWSALYQGSGKRNMLGADSALHVPYAGGLTELYVGNGSVVTAGVVNLTSDQRLSYKNYGEYVITGEMTMAGSDRKDGYAGYSAGTSAANVFKIEKATCNKTDGYTFYFAESHVASHGTYYFGAGGINFGAGNGYFGIGKNADGDAQTIRPWYGDFTIGTTSGNDSKGYDIYCFRDVAFNTDDEGGVGRTITVDARLRFQNAPSFTIAGSGKVLVNSAANNAAQPSVTVTDTATLAMKPGASLTTSNITVNAGATLEVAQSGIVTLDCDLLLANNACLGFNFTSEDAAPTLAIAEGKTLALPEGGTVNVSVAGLPGQAGTAYTLVSGGDFAAGDLSGFSFTANPAITFTAPEAGVLAATVTPRDYVWNGDSGAEWGAANAWTVGGAAATWLYMAGNSATFAENGARARIDAPVSPSRIDFDANATVEGDAELAVPEVSVAPNVSASITAPTAGPLEKTGSGTLTLGESRSDETTVSGGTLAMAPGATLDGSKLTLGTDAAKPVTLDFGGGTLSGDLGAYVGGGMDVTLANGTFYATDNAASAPQKLTLANARMDFGSPQIPCVSAADMAISNDVTVVVHGAGYTRGEYPILTKTGGGSFTEGDVARLALDVSDVTGLGVTSSLELGGTGNSSICLRVPARCVWTGGGGDGDITNPANWDGNVAPSVGEVLGYVSLAADEVALDGGSLAVAAGGTFVLPDAGTYTVSLDGGFSAGTANGGGDPVYVQLGDGNEPVAPGCYVLMEATSITGVNNLRLGNSTVKPGAKGVDDGDAVFALYGGEGRYRLALFVGMEPPKEWVNESESTKELTGTWTVPVDYDAEGLADIAANSFTNSFTPLIASTGRVVTVEMQASLEKGYCGNAVEDGTKAGMRLGDGVFQLYTRTNDVPAWIDVVAEGVSPKEGVEYGIKFVLDETNRTYSAAVSNTTSGAFALLKSGDCADFDFASAGASPAVTAFDFVGDSRLKFILGTCTNEVQQFFTGDEIALSGAVRLTPAQAAWLNAAGPYATISSKVASFTAERFETAYLCNLVVTNDSASAVLMFSGARMAGGNLEVDVTLSREGAMQAEGRNAPINGTLKIYGATEIGGAADILISTVYITNETFGSGDVATIAIGAIGDDIVMLSGVIE